MFKLDLWRPVGILNHFDKFLNPVIRKSHIIRFQPETFCCMFIKFSQNEKLNNSFFFIVNFFLLKWNFLIKKIDEILTKDYSLENSFRDFQSTFFVFLLQFRIIGFYPYATWNENPPILFDIPLTISSSFSFLITILFLFSSLHQEPINLTRQHNRKQNCFSLKL